MSKEFTTKCPKCGEVIEIDEYYEVGDEIICTNCDVDLKIEKMNPLKLKVVRRDESLDELEDEDDQDEEWEEDSDNFDDDNREN